MAVLGVAEPSARLYRDYNQAQGVIVPRGTSAGGTVRYLGGKADADRCEGLCRASTPRCHSFVLLAGGECYGVATPGFNPSYEPGTVSGVLEWGCRGDADCSLNGRCDPGTGECACRAAWTGRRCETLRLDPAPRRDAGFRSVDGGKNTSTWGGAVLRGKGDGALYHMWAAEMTEHCGIGAWRQNSRIVHATSRSPGGPYVRRDVVWDVFSHEPEVVPGPNGEYVMFFTADIQSKHGFCDCCRPGHGPCDGSTGPGDCSGKAPGRADSWMSWTMDPDGNWSDPVKLFPTYTGSDTNFAPIILPNGSLVAMWRRWTSRGSRQYIATAADWRDPSTYVQHHRELFVDLGTAGTEDQFLYRDTEGNFHAVFHHMYGTGTKEEWWLDPTGGHAFSRNGLDWTYTGVSWGDPLARYNTPAGQGQNVTFADGFTAKFTRLERPHLIFASNALAGDPIYLINSAQCTALPSRARTIPCPHLLPQTEPAPIRASRPRTTTRATPW